MEKTDHVMLIGQGANDFAKEMGVAQVEPEHLVTTEAKKEWKEYAKFNRVVSEVFNNPSTCTHQKSNLPDQQQATVEEAALGHTHSHDTVGAVAMDVTGNIAAATSTGGISLKRVGRVGDTPLVGSGAYCDNEIGGASCTGHGEAIAMVVLAHRTLSLLQSSRKDGEHLPTAVEVIERSLKFMLERTGGRGGVIMITNRGEIAKSFTTPRMCWASVDQNGILESGLE